MSMETLVYTALKGLVSNRVYRDIAPDTVTELPRITFQQITGSPINFLDNATTPVTITRVRVQVSVWHSSRDACMALSRQVREALRAVAALQTHVETEAMAVLEPNGIGPSRHLYGAHQDYSFCTDD